MEGKRDAECEVEAIAIIPARGGSKGIPCKNLQPLAGMPLLTHTIFHALGTPSVRRVIVSTDDPAIASVAGESGAEVIWRPPEISEDISASESALIHALDHLRDDEGYEPSLVVFLQATSPLRRPDDIQNAIDTIRREQADSLFSACHVHGFVWRSEAERLWSVTYDHRYRKRRQELGQDLMENGSIYVFKPWVLRELNNRLGGRIAVYEMNAIDSFQVDEPADLELIEQLLRVQRPPSKSAHLDRVRLLVLDFDGVMTDNRVLVDQNGSESVWCNRADGWGIARLKEVGIEVLVLSTETNRIVAERCRKLRIECIQACDDKISALREVARQRSLKPDEIAFVGNDVNDLECLRWAGVAITVADAVPAARATAQLVTTRSGGRGAVRELADWLLEARGNDQISKCKR